MVNTIIGTAAMFLIFLLLSLLFSHSFFNHHNNAKENKKKKKENTINVRFFVLCCMLLLIIYTRCRTSYHSIRQSPDRSAWSSCPNQQENYTVALLAFDHDDAAYSQRVAMRSGKKSHGASLPLQCHYPGRWESLGPPGSL